MLVLQYMLPYQQVKREILVRRKAETSPQYGCPPEQRQTEKLLDYGVVCINKPAGPTSHQTVDFVKQILQISKAGHSGTLDPGVTGVLVVALGKCTRVVDVLLKSGKEYVCLMRIHSDIDEQTIRKHVAQYIGKIEQLPPKKSAVKRQWRTREIYYLEILEINGRDVLFRVGCQAGTYIRKLCTDLGFSMGTKAHMQELVRTKVGHFTDENWVSLHDLKDAYEEWKEGDDTPLRKCIEPIENAVAFIPKVWVIDTAVDSLCHGAFLSTPGIVKLESGIEVGDTVALLTLKNELLGLGVAKMNAQNMLRQQKGYAVADMRIFLDRGTYPKFVKKE